MSVLSQVLKGRDRLPPRLLIYGSEGIGKAQPLDAMVLTLKGFIPIGRIQEGDQVIGSEGKAYRVTGVYPQGMREIYRVSFRDGSSTRCCDDHLWLTQTREEHATQQSGSVKPLREIRTTLLCGLQFNHDVQRVQPVVFAPSDSPLPVDPFVLGQYLGDDCKSVLASFEEDALASGMLNISVQSKRGSINLPAPQEMPCLKHVRIENSFIPQEYLLASIEERIALLRGLLDCDEAIRHSGLIEFGCISRQLALDVCFLIRSLGGSAMLGDKEGGHTYAGRTFQGNGSYRVHAAFPDGIATGTNEKPTGVSTLPDALRHSIRAVESLGQAECVCIRTDAPDSLYVTDDLSSPTTALYPRKLRT